MNHQRETVIDPASVAFDIDGVFADTMRLFLDIARQDYHIDHIRYEDITSYHLEQCLQMDPSVINAIVRQILDGTYSVALRPISGAPEVMTRLARRHSPVLFVTARPYPGPICDWLQQVLPLESVSVDVITTGSFEAKPQVLVSRNITCFVEDRLETCFAVKEAGVTPVLFKQPWNRGSHPFAEVSDWCELESLIEY